MMTRTQHVIMRVKTCMDDGNQEGSQMAVKNTRTGNL